jgi:hypothetical protein
MKKLIYFLAIFLLSGLIITSCNKNESDFQDVNASESLKKGKPKKAKVGIYHVNDEGGYNLIFVSENAVPAHLAHGDLLLIVPVKEEDLAQDALDLLQNPWKWYFYDDGPENEGIDPTVGTMVPGPGTPPEGEGSAQISVIDQQRYNLATSQYGGTKLADITSFAFSTYNPSAGNGGNPNSTGFINFNVSFDGTLAFQSRLSFLPGANGTVMQDTWQEWDAIGDGTTLWKWEGYSGNDGKWPDGEMTELRTWNDILANFPDIEMHSLFPFLSVRVGSPNPDGYTENIDAFKFGVDGIDQTYDFEE